MVLQRLKRALKKLFRSSRDEQPLHSAEDGPKDQKEAVSAPTNPNPGEDTTGPFGNETLLSFDFELGSGPSTGLMDGIDSVVEGPKCTQDGLEQEQPQQGKASVKLQKTEHQRKLHREKSENLLKAKARRLATGTTTGSTKRTLSISRPIPICIDEPSTQQLPENGVAIGAPESNNAIKKKFPDHTRAPQDQYLNLLAAQTPFDGPVHSTRPYPPQNSSIRKSKSLVQPAPANKQQNDEHVPSPENAKFKESKSSSNRNPRSLSLECPSTFFESTQCPEADTDSGFSIDPNASSIDVTQQNTSVTTPASSRTPSLSLTNCGTGVPLTDLRHGVSDCQPFVVRKPRVRQPLSNIFPEAAAQIARESARSVKFEADDGPELDDKALDLNEDLDERKFVDNALVAVSFAGSSKKLRFDLEDSVATSHPVANVTTVQQELPRASIDVPCPSSKHKPPHVQIGLLNDSDTDPNSFHFSRARDPISVKSQPLTSHTAPMEKGFGSSLQPAADAADKAVHGLTSTDQAQDPSVDYEPPSPPLDRYYTAPTSPTSLGESQESILGPQIDSIIERKDLAIGVEHPPNDPAEESSKVYHVSPPSFSTGESAPNIPENLRPNPTKSLWREQIQTDNEATSTWPRKSSSKATATLAKDAPHTHPRSIIKVPRNESCETPSGSVMLDESGMRASSPFGIETTYHPGVATSSAASPPPRPTHSGDYETADGIPKSRVIPGEPSVPSDLSLSTYGGHLSEREEGDEALQVAALNVRKNYSQTTSYSIASSSPRPTPTCIYSHDSAVQSTTSHDRPSPAAWKGKKPVYQRIEAPVMNPALNFLSRVFLEAASIHSGRDTLSPARIIPPTLESFTPKSPSRQSIQEELLQSMHISASETPEIDPAAVNIGEAYGSRSSSRFDIKRSKFKDILEIEASKIPIPALEPMPKRQPELRPRLADYNTRAYIRRDNPKLKARRLNQGVEASSTYAQRETIVTPVADESDIHPAFRSSSARPIDTRNMRRSWNVDVHHRNDVMTGLGRYACAEQRKETATKERTFRDNEDNGA